MVKTKEAPATAGQQSAVLRLARQYSIQVEPAGPKARSVDEIVAAAQKDATGARSVEDVLRFWLKEANVDALVDAPVPEKPTAEAVDKAFEKQFPLAVVDEPRDEEMIEASVISPVSIVDVNAASAYYANLSELKKRLLGPTDIQDIKGRTFVKKSGWRKLAFAFEVTVIAGDPVREERQAGSYIYRVRATARAKNGRTSSGTGMCSSTEKAGMIEHVVMSTAETRAKNRAISDLVAAGEVSAEEIGE